MQQVGGQQNGNEPGLLENVAPDGAANRPPVGHDDNDNNDEIAAKKIRIMYFSMPWTQVLPSIANKAGLILVMRRCPGGTFQHPDFREMTVAEALQVINKELDDTNFRLVRQGQFLVVLYTPDLRTEYERPVVRSRRNHSRVTTTRPSSGRRPRGRTLACGKSCTRPRRGVSRWKARPSQPLARNICSRKRPVPCC